MNVFVFAVVTAALTGSSSRSGWLLGETRVHGASAAVVAAASPLEDDLVNDLEADVPEEAELVVESEPPQPSTSSPSTAANTPAGLCICSPTAAATAADGSKTTGDVVEPASTPRTATAGGAMPRDTDDVPRPEPLVDFRRWLYGGGPSAIVAAAASKKAKNDSAPGRLASPLPPVDARRGAENNGTPPADGAEQLLSPSPNATSSLGCPHGFYTIRDWDYCYLLSTFNTTRALAREYCYAMGADVELLTINSSREHFLVTYLIQQTAASKDADDWWTSGVQLSRSHWAWRLRVRMAEMRFSMWSQSAPASAEGGRCVTLQKSSSYYWSSDKCSDDTRSLTGFPRHNFICKAPATKPRPCI